MGNQIIYSDPFYTHRLDNIFGRGGFCHYHEEETEILIQAMLIALFLKEIVMICIYLIESFFKNIV